MSFTFQQVWRLIFMSKEMDLLKRILATGWLDHELSCEVEELLAQPEQEPVEDRIARWHKLGYQQGRKSLKREPLSDEEVIAKYRAITLYAPSYYAGFRDAEKAHGIGGGE